VKHTQEFLKSLPEDTIFATGLVWDTEGINVTGKRVCLQYVAVRGVVADWSVYVAEAGEDFSYTARTGHKVSLRTACALVDCDEAMRKTYRS